jgi:flagellar biosynthesis/type III secretory pathway protein FliH
MVTYRYLERKFLKPLIEKQRAEAERRQAEAMATGRAKGMAEGRAAGREEERLKWTAWNLRREEAEKKGEPFNEPPPSP